MVILASWAVFINEGIGLFLMSKATGKREFILPWREAGPQNHIDNSVGLNQ
jgi:hypothetical protein